MDEEQEEVEFQPTRWWRVLDPEGGLWCETSSKREALAAKRPKDTLEHLFERVQYEWREVNEKEG